MNDLTKQPAWYFRRNGWVQGPFTTERIRYLYSVSELHGTDQIANAPHGPWQRLQLLHAVIAADHDDRPHDASSLSPAGPIWECVAARNSADSPVDYGMLQLLAAAGRLQPQDMIRRRPDGDWQPAQSVPGIFGGHRGWCFACGASLEQWASECPSCHAQRPSFEKTLAGTSVTCGAIAIAWQLVSFAAIAALALNGRDLGSVPMDEYFPQVFALTTLPAAWLAGIAILLGANARRAIRAGLAAPEESSLASLGSRLGYAGFLIIVITAVALSAYGLSHFRLAPS